MPDIAKVLKEEIQRLARKEIRVALAKLRADNTALKRTTSEQKHRILQLEKKLQRLATGRSKPVAEPSDTDAQEVPLGRITGKMVRSMRSRMGVSQADLALLLGVSAQTVYQWERKDGRLTFRGNSAGAMAEVRNLKAREARERVAQLKEQAR